MRIMKVDNVQVIDQAQVPRNPVKPRPMLNMIIAGFLGIMISLGMVFVMEYLDNTIKSPNDVERYLGLPIIGAIPEVDDVENK